MWTLTKYFIVGAIALFWFQTTTPGPGGTTNVATTASTSKASLDVSTAVSPTQAVITVHGVCEEGKDKGVADARACTTVITREQFERLMVALQPGKELPTIARNNLGRLYSEYLVVEGVTRKSGMEDTAEFREFTNWTRVLAATEYYRRKLQEKLSNPPQEEIDTYYKQHLADYETVKLARVLVPRENPSAPNKDEFEKKAHDIANAAQSDLAKGIDPTEIQKKAYNDLGLQMPPPVDQGNKRRKDLLPEQSAEAFSLKAGGVTQVITEPRDYVIYKVLSKDVTSEESLKAFISGQITSQKFKDAMKTAEESASVDLNEQYFTPAPPDTGPLVSPHPMVTH